MFYRGRIMASYGILPLLLVFSSLVIVLQAECTVDENGGTVCPGIDEQYPGIFETKEEIDKINNQLAQQNVLDNSYKAFHHGELNLIVHSVCCTIGTRMTNVTTACTLDNTLVSVVRSELGTQNIMVDYLSSSSDVNCNCICTDRIYTLLSTADEKHFKFNIIKYPGVIRYMNGEVKSSNQPRNSHGECVDSRVSQQCKTKHTGHKEEL